MDRSRTDDEVSLKFRYDDTGGYHLNYSQPVGFDSERMLDGIPEEVVERALTMWRTPLENKILTAARSLDSEDRRGIENFLILRRCQKIQAQDRQGRDPGLGDWLARRLTRAQEPRPMILRDPDDMRPRAQAQPRPSQDRCRDRSQ